MIAELVVAVALVNELALGAVVVAVETVVAVVGRSAQRSRVEDRRVTRSGGVIVPFFFFRCFFASATGQADGGGRNTYAFFCLFRREWACPEEVWGENEREKKHKQLLDENHVRHDFWTKLGPTQTANKVKHNIQGINQSRLTPLRLHGTLLTQETEKGID